MSKLAAVLPLLLLCCFAALAIHSATEVRAAAVADVPPRMEPVVMLVLRSFGLAPEFDPFGR
jgi:hypothetical protein